ncbi:MAG: DUF4421 family protein [Prevotella sp.]|nr:DUF4421 family protein [Prevotella sp.]
MMTRQTRILAIVAILLTKTIRADAQKFKFNHFVDSVLMSRYWRADIDTNYITRPQTKWTLVGRVKMTGARIKAEGVDNGQHFKTELQADNKTTVSAGVSYLGLAVSLAINPAKLLGKYHDYELGFRSYGKRFGFDIAYQDASNFRGWHELEGVREEVTTSEDMFKLRTFNVNAYYAFNYRHFSYPAAMAHSYLQRRSAGSFLLAASGQGQHGKVNSDHHKMDFKMTNIGIGAGYAYNYVPASGWLLHFSALPTLIVYSNTSLTTGDTEIPLHYRFPEVIITSRSAVVKQIGNNKFAGLSVVFNYCRVGDRDELAIRNQKWLARLYFGFRL